MTRIRIERLQCHPGKSGGHVFWCLQFCYRMFTICNRLFTTCNRTRDTKKHGRRSSQDDTATSLYDVKVLYRIWDSVLSRTHYVALFSRESLASDLANRLSKVADVPVASEDGLSRFILEQQPRLLTNKDPTLTASGSNSQVQVTNRIQVVLGHLLRLGSVDQGLSG